jgi:hypothetical protein
MTQIADPVHTILSGFNTQGLLVGAATYNYKEWKCYTVGKPCRAEGYFKTESEAIKWLKEQGAVRVIGDSGLME